LAARLAFQFGHAVFLQAALAVAGKRLGGVVTQLAPPA
jgi:hypothetical protein